MASAERDEITYSGDSENEGNAQTPERATTNPGQSPPLSALSYRFRDLPKKVSEQTFERATRDKSSASKNVAVMLSAPSRPWEYQPFMGNTTVDSILEEIDAPDEERWFQIEYVDGKKDRVPLSKLTKLRNGQNAVNMFDDEGNDSQDLERSSAEPTRASKRARTSTVNNGYVNIANISFSEEEEDGMSAGPAATKKRRLGNGSIPVTTRDRRQTSRQAQESFHNQDDSSDSEPPVLKTRGRKAGTSLSTRLSSRFKQSAEAKVGSRSQHKGSVSSKEENEDEGEDELAGDGPQNGTDGSDIVYQDPKVKKKAPKAPRGRRRPSTKAAQQEKPRRGRPRIIISESESDCPQQPSRRSGRAVATKDMREHEVDDEYFAEETTINNGPKVINIREIYQPVEKDSPFRQFHRNECDVCKSTGSSTNKGALVYCQGCSTSIHKVCLGYRSGREHMVTKVGHENFVLQCRRCIGITAKKDDLAPLLDVCQSCKKKGVSCKSFSVKKTAKQEERLREENDGQDPITMVAPNLLNNAENILFRCTTCQLGYHFQHLPSLPKQTKPLSAETIRETRLKQYSHTWQCNECRNAPAKVQTLVAWRPANREAYEDGQTAEDFRDDEKEYLIKWEDKSYFQCLWKPGGWVWGVTTAMMRNSFFRRDEGANLIPKWTNEEAIAEEYLRMEIIFEVRYTSVFRSKSEKADRAAINMVEEVFVKFQGLGYEESVWEDPPEPEDAARWSDFVAAYNEFIAGKYFSQPPASTMKDRLVDYRASKFKEMAKQPSALVGGEMMKYQLEGMNWLLYNFHEKKNVILADEMGLGKTIQIIALLAALVKHNPKSWPFLVVTPNSTCPNWRREIKKWAPDLRVVAYYGGKKARQMAMDHELYPDGSSELSAHVVITSYEGPVDDSSRSFFRKIKWAGMIVDEGQRLKNDENLLYGALKALKAPFQVLLTGTPLQNNKRELFNLLQFLDASINAAKLDEEYAELTKDNLPKLHDLIRPFFLRRTKLQVLKFLPPMAQVILPVTMSVVQKKLYKSILARNPQLIKSIFGQSKAAIGPKDKSNLNNILMQLRKCLCHPFVYSNAIEERSVDEVGLHRNLVDASSKFQLLEIMLPKLQARGNRVLIFSQFLMQLDLIEDFLNGLDLPFERLDGTIGALEKQRRIDAYNAPDSPLFAFLLSTRSGGVGINLATADTVIIMDPDFNPHQDIQALSRAHRIGQKKKVLCFQLMTKNSAEEKIVQIGRKKMALDQALIESMDAEDDADVDLESILKFGAEALFNDDDRNDIRYDSASVDKLLDRTQLETINADEEKSTESQFSFARVWANDKTTLTDDIGDADAEVPIPDFSVWEQILKQREADAAQEAARNAQTFGRGKRARGNVNYEKQNDDDLLENSPKKAGKTRDKPASDLDFGTAGSDGEAEEDEEDSDFGGQVDLKELAAKQNRPSEALSSSSKIKGTVKLSSSTANKLAKFAKKAEGVTSKKTIIQANAVPKLANRKRPKQILQQPIENKPSVGTPIPKAVIAEKQKRIPVNSLLERMFPQQNSAFKSSKSLWAPSLLQFKQRCRTRRAGIQSKDAQASIPAISQGQPSYPAILPPARPQYTVQRPEITVGKDSKRRQDGPRPQPGAKSGVVHGAQLGHGGRGPIPLVLNGNRDGQPQPSHSKNYTPQTQANQKTLSQFCQACRGLHHDGGCPRMVKIAERCGLCNLAHFGITKTCPHLSSEAQIRLMLDALRRSTEPKQLVDNATDRLRKLLVERAQMKNSARRAYG